MDILDEENRQAIFYILSQKLNELGYDLENPWTWFYLIIGLFTFFKAYMYVYNLIYPVTIVQIDGQPRRLQGSYQELGAGAFGQVQLYRLENGQGGIQEVAVKKFYGDNAPTLQMIEAAQLNRVGQHPCIVKFFTACTIGTTTAIVMEYMPGGTLRHLLDTWWWNHPSWTRKLAISISIARGLDHLHRLGFMTSMIHQDLKSTNVLIDSQGNAKLADFGLARTFWRIRIPGYGTVRIGAYDNALGGTLPYMAPEAFQALVGLSPDKITTQADIFSLGILLWEIATARHPQRRPQEIQEGIFTPMQRGAAEDPIHQAGFFAVVRRCLMPNGSRPTTQTVVRDLEEEMTRHVVR